MAVYQCTRCGYWSRDREAVIDHLWTVHHHEMPIRAYDFAVRDDVPAFSSQGGVRRQSELGRAGLAEKRSLAADQRAPADQRALEARRAWLGN